jgi:hypothetical protein
MVAQANRLKVVDMYSTEDHDQAFYLSKAAEYRDKAAATRELLLRHAFTAVAFEYLRKARACGDVPDGLADAS